MAAKFQLTRPTKGPRPERTKYMTAKRISTHAAHEGAASHTPPACHRPCHFNSRGPRRGRAHQGRFADDGCPISTHAAHEGAAREPQKRGADPDISTHAAHEGAAQSASGHRSGRPISTHAAHEGAAAQHIAFRVRQSISTHAAHEGAAAEFDHFRLEYRYGRSLTRQNAFDRSESTESSISNDIFTVFKESLCICQTTGRHTPNCTAAVPS